MWEMAEEGVESKEVWGGVGWNSLDQGREPFREDIKEEGKKQWQGRIQGGGSGAVPPSLELRAISLFKS